MKLDYQHLSGAHNSVNSYFGQTTDVLNKMPQNPHHYNVDPDSSCQTHMGTEPDYGAHSCLFTE
jgi:hypothetical protein